MEVRREPWRFLCYLVVTLTVLIAVVVHRLRTSADSSRRTRSSARLQVDEPPPTPPRTEQSDDTVPIGEQLRMAKAAEEEDFQQKKNAEQKLKEREARLAHQEEAAATREEQVAARSAALDEQQQQLEELAQELREQSRQNKIERQRIEKIEASMTVETLAAKDSDLTRRAEQADAQMEAARASNERHLRDVAAFAGAAAALEKGESSLKKRTEDLKTMEAQIQRSLLDLNAQKRSHLADVENFEEFKSRETARLEQASAESMARHQKLLDAASNRLTAVEEREREQNTT
eukprot:SAG11_NODE_4397_length_1913_cov_2.036384_1_plen_289_part_01